METILFCRAGTDGDQRPTAVAHVASPDAKCPGLMRVKGGNHGWRQIRKNSAMIALKRQLGGKRWYYGPAFSSVSRL